MRQNKQGFTVFQPFLVASFWHLKVEMYSLFTKLKKTKLFHIVHLDVFSFLHLDGVYEKLTVKMFDFLSVDLVFSRDKTVSQQLLFRFILGNLNLFD